MIHAGVGAAGSTKSATFRRTKGLQPKPASQVSRIFQIGGNTEGPKSLRPRLSSETTHLANSDEITGARTFFNRRETRLSVESK